MEAQRKEALLKILYLPLSYVDVISFMSPLSCAEG